LDATVTLTDVFAESPGGGVPFAVVRASGEDVPGAPDLERVALEFGRPVLLLSGEPFAARAEEHGAAARLSAEGALAASRVLVAEGVRHPSIQAPGEYYTLESEGPLLWLRLPRPTLSVAEPVPIPGGGDDAGGGAWRTGRLHLADVVDPIRLSRLDLDPDGLAAALRAEDADGLALFAATASADHLIARFYRAGDGREVPASARAAAGLCAALSERTDGAVSLTLESGASAGRPSLTRARCPDAASLAVWVGGSVLAPFAGTWSG